jgi:diguanylate cyclase (GGDEF)-like protein
MSKMDSWFKTIIQKREACDDHLMTQGEFAVICNDILGDSRSPLCGFTIRIACPPLPEQTFGSSCDGQPKSSLCVPIGSSGESECTIALWPSAEITPSESPNTIEACNTALSRLVSAYWKPDMRDEKTRLLSLHVPRVKALADKTILRYVEIEKPISVFYIDLDRFKAINDKYGQATGDKLILHLSGLLSTALGPSDALDSYNESGIPLHVGGDEFSALLPIQYSDEAIRMAHTIATSALTNCFVEPMRAEKVPLSISIGIAIGKGWGGASSFDGLLSLAEKAIKPNGDKIRGSVRLQYALEQALGPKQNTLFARNTALAVIKSRFVNSRPFSNPWLNSISQITYRNVMASGLNVSQVQSQASELISWIRPDIDNAILSSACFSDREVSAHPIFSSTDTALAVAHGIMRAYALGAAGFADSNRLAIDHNDEWTSVALKVQSTGETCWENSQAIPRSSQWDIGQLWSLQGSCPNTNVTSAIAILVKIGHLDLSIPYCAFADVIVLDDRPTRGGGLPDFSYAALARLISVVDINLNISTVYVLGNIDHGKNTVEALKHLENWDAEAEVLSSKTTMRPDSIRNVSRRLVNSIVFCKTEDELASGLANVVLGQRVISDINQKDGLGASVFLDRDLRASNFTLGREDGCCVRTAAEAFPIVLEIARTAVNLPLINDQAGQKLKELVDFKVCLTEPSNGKIPVFYNDVKAEMDSYFENVFMENDGLFGGPLRRDNQLEYVLSHLENILSHTSNCFATRRAILVIPHIPTSPDVAPLGLVSIRILPRFEGEKTVLHYSYTWRTVEVLVGFPYSIYGSIRFSEYLTNEIHARVPTKKTTIQMGTLSYVAHSLHMFVDDYGQNIARKIVNDATR